MTPPEARRLVELYALPALTRDPFEAFLRLDGAMASEAHRTACKARCEHIGAFAPHAGDRAAVRALRRFFDGCELLARPEAVNDT